MKPNEVQIIDNPTIEVTWSDIARSMKEGQAVVVDNYKAVNCLRQFFYREDGKCRIKKQGTTWLVKCVRRGGE